MPPSFPPRSSSYLGPWFAVAGKDVIMIAALARPVQPRLVDAALDDRYLALLVQILDAAVLQALAHRPLDQCLGPAQEPLAIGQALASRIEAAVDDGIGRASVRERVCEYG